MHQYSFLVFTSLLLAVVGCKAPTDVPTRGTISGSVSNARTGAPVPEATIQTEPFTQSVSTTTDGLFTISSVPVGDYTVTASCEAFSSRSATVTVPGGGCATSDFAIMPTKGDITVTVMNIKTGHLLEKVAISTSPPTRGTTTDPSGYAAIPSISRGTYTIQAKAEGYSPVEKTVVVAGGDRTDTEIRLRPTHGSILLTVTDAKTAASVSGAVVTTSPETERGVSDSAGRLFLGPIVQGPYAATLESDGYSDCTIAVSVTGGDTTVSAVAMVPTRGTLSGRVKESGTGHPVADALVSTQPATRRVQSDTGGFFSLKSLEEKTYVVVVEKDGYAAASESLTVYGGTVTTAPIDLVSLTGSCRGIVTNAKTGKPVSDAVISTDPPSHGVTTDSAGNYRLERIAVGNYTVRIEKDGCFASSKAMRITAGGAALLNFVLTPSTGAISGQVLDETTELPIEQAILSTTPATVTVATDDMGRYSFPAIPTGSYSLTAQKQAYRPESESLVVKPGEEATAALAMVRIPDSIGIVEGKITNAATGFPVSDVTIGTDPETQTVKSDAQGDYYLSNMLKGGYSLSFSKTGYSTAVKQLEVEGGRTATANISIVPINGSIAGIISDDVTGELLSGVSVSTTPATETVVSDATGAYRLNAVPSGNYTLTAAKSDFVPGMKTIEVIGGSQSAADISLVPSHGSITGKITDTRTLDPLSGVTITTSPATKSTTTGADGSFTMDRIAAGTYTIDAAMADYSTSSLQIQVSGGRTSTADMALTPSKGAISGRVVNAKTGAAIEGAAVATDPVTVSVAAAATGVYTIRDISLRDYEVSVTADGFTPLTKAATVKGGETTTLDFSLTPNRGSISGNVTDSRTGVALADVTISTTPATLTVTTNAEGDYSLGPIGVGDYTVTAALNGYSSVSRQIAVDPGETSVASFVLTSQNGSISGKVTDHTGTRSLRGVVLTTTPATVSVTTDANGDFVFSTLPPRTYTVKAVRQGYYDATVEVQVTAAEVASATIQMEEIVPVLAVSPATLNYSTQQTSLQLSVSNSAGQGVLTYDIQKPETATWLTLSRTDGSVVSDPDAIICTVDRSALEPGNYLADLVATSNGGSATVQAVMTVPDPESPQLTLSRSLLDFGTSGNELRFTVSNTGDGTLTYTISDDMEWLTTTPSSGSLNANPAIITVSADRTALNQIKTYNGRITVSSNGGSAGIDVSLETASPPLEPVTLSVTNVTSGGCRLTWTQVANTAHFSSYDIYESATADFTLAEATRPASLSAYTTLSYNVSSAEQTTRYYRVYAVNTTGAGTSSNELAVTFPAAVRPWTHVLNSETYGYTLKDIRSLSDTDAWACGWEGSYGVVLQWDNVARVWNEMPLPDNVDKVYRLHPLSPDLIYASATGTFSGTRKAVVLKSSGNAWSVCNVGITVETSSSVRGGDIHVFNDNLIYITFQPEYTSSSTMLYEIVDGAWNETGVEEWHLWFTDENTGYVSGENDYIRKYNGFGWVQLPYTDAGTFGRAVMGNDGSLVTHKKEKVYVYANDDLQQTLDPEPNGYRTSMQTVFGIDSTWIWVGGKGHYNYPDRLLHYNGTRFEKITITDNPGFYRFWFHSKQSGWALADNGIHLYR